MQRKIQCFALYLGLTQLLDEDKELSKNHRLCPAGQLPHKEAELYRGFLVYMSRTYPAMVPYLKGIHLTIDSWQTNGDKEGWKNTSTVEAKCETSEQEKPPCFV
jgi:hypothetical protein